MLSPDLLESLPDDAAPAALIARQRALAPHVVRTGDPRPLSVVAGVDVAYGETPVASGRVPACAAAVALDAVSLAEVGRAELVTDAPASYQPGGFALRELRPALAALHALAGVLGAPPDVVLVDAQGVAHPHRCGLASHLGLLLGWPTIGVGKTRLLGVAEDPAVTRGSSSPLIDAGETIGVVLRTQTGVRPLYVSVGHRVALDIAARIVVGCAPRYRLPEPIRAADQLVRAARASLGAGA